MCLTPVPDSLDSSEVQRGASDSSSWGDGPVWASCCTFSIRWLMNTELSCGGCQRGFLMVKCIRESSVLPFSACWYTEASVWPSDIHWARGEETNIWVCTMKLHPPNYMSKHACDLWCAFTCGLPWRLMSIWANEQMSPTPATSTVKLRKKSMISKDLLRRGKMRMKGVIMGLRSSSKIKTCRTERNSVSGTPKISCTGVKQMQDEDSNLKNRWAKSDKLLDHRCREVRYHFTLERTENSTVPVVNHQPYSFSAVRHQVFCLSVL